MYCSANHPETWQNQYKCADGYIYNITGALEYRLTDAIETVPVPVKVCQACNLFQKAAITKAVLVHVVM